MITLKVIEKQYLKLKNDEISNTAFEQWVHDNETKIVSEDNSALYEDLILLNFQSTELKHELSKLLKIDFEKLELSEIENELQIILNEKENEYLNVKFNIDDYEPFWTYYSFQIGESNFIINDLFQTDQISQPSPLEKEADFKEKMCDAKSFVQILLNSITGVNFRIWNAKSTEQVDPIKESKIVRKAKNELKLMINRHHCFIKKNYLEEQIKKARL